MLGSVCEMYVNCLMLTFRITQSVQSLSHVQLFATPLDCSTSGFPVHHQLPEPTQTHVHYISDVSNDLILCHTLLLLP